MRKKTTTKKLELTTETLRRLSATELAEVVGGTASDRCTDHCPSHGGTCGSSCRPD